MLNRGTFHISETASGFTITLVPKFCYKESYDGYTVLCQASGILQDEIKTKIVKVQSTDSYYLVIQGQSEIRSSGSITYYYPPFQDAFRLPKDIDISSESKLFHEGLLVVSFVKSTG